MKAAFYTLGCKVNQYETDAMIQSFRQHGFEIVDFGSVSDVYVINSCSVTAVSEKKTRQMVARAHSANKGAVIAVCGCYAVRSAEELLELPGVRIACGTKDRSSLVIKVLDAINNPDEKVISIANASAFENLSALSESKTRALLKIQDGCDNFCSYCIIPYLRGSICSRDLRSISDEAIALKNSGFEELVVTGINLSAYGKDNNSNLVEALERIVKCGIGRIRLGSLDPGIITPEFVSFVKDNESICRHFHLSMQSGSDFILKQMNRKYSSYEYLSKVHMLREAFDCAITTDIIAGFPGETDEHHLETMAFVEKVGFARIHVFPYSIRTGTIAATMPCQLAPAIKKKRVQELISVGEALSKKYIDEHVGLGVEILVELCENGVSGGYSKEYIEVKLPGQFEPGAIIAAVITGRSGLMAMCSCGQI